LLGAWAAFLGAVTFIIGMVLRRDVVPTTSTEMRVSAPSLAPMRTSRPNAHRRSVPRGD